MPWVLILLGSFLFTLPARAEWKLKLSAESVKQGGVLWVEMETRETLERPRCRWLGKTYSMYAAPSGYQVVLPIDRLRKTGPTELTVEAAGFEQPLARKTVSITPLDTGPIQLIRLSPETMAREDDPQIKEDSKRLGEVINTRSSSQLWTAPFGPPSEEPGRNFGKQRRYVEAARKGQKRRPGFVGYHRGTDFPLGAGTPVRAANDAVVIEAKGFVLPGNAVFLDHGQGIVTGYLHLQKALVKPGDKVRRGDVIGLVGSTGRSTGPHLHWSVYAQGQAVNPDALLALTARAAGNSVPGQ